MPPVQPTNQQDSAENQKIPTTPPVAKESPRTFQPISPFGQPEKKEYTPNPQLKTLRTYQGDVEETIHKKKESVASIAIAEQKAKEKPPQKDEHFVLPEQKGIAFLTRGILPVVGLALVILGVVVLSGVYYYLNVNTAPVKVAANTTLVSYTTKYDSALSVTTDIRSQIIQTISNQKTTFNQPVGSILYIHFLQNNVDLSASDFFQSLAPNAPPALSRALGPYYMAGLYSFDKNQTFIILSAADYGEVYAGMLSWEANMKDDLSPLFPDIQNSSFATTTTFTDETFSNKDVRVLRNENGDIVLLYGFLDKNTFAITANEKIYQQLVTKYINSKLVH